MVKNISKCFGIHMFIYFVCIGKHKKSEKKKPNVMIFHTELQKWTGLLKKWTHSCYIGLRSRDANSAGIQATLPKSATQPPLLLPHLSTPLFNSAHNNS